MFQPDQDGVYARVDVAPARRTLALIVTGGLGVLLIWLGFSSLAGFVGRMVLIAMGVFMVVLTIRMRSAAERALVLTDDGIFQDDGEVVARMEDIASIDRGAFAIKPSNGFSVRLKQPAPRAWRPGLWWRLGRRVGVGGIVSAGAAKFMAEQIALRLSSQST